jgi:hypothetical protein
LTLANHLAMLPTVGIQIDPHIKSGARIMAKGRDKQKKTDGKKAQKTLKEKRQEKRNKRA